jgi:hypothetical protein
VTSFAKVTTVLATLLVCSSLPVSAAANKAAVSQTKAATTIIAVGDMACEPHLPCDQQGVADLVDPSRHSALLALGDLQYHAGKYSHFIFSYDQVWGEHYGMTYPTPGNHEYITRGAAGYFKYFEPRFKELAKTTTGSPQKGWYSFKLGSWHVVSLNSNCYVIGCGPNSQQVKWLKNDLRRSKSACTIAFFHHPRFASGEHGNYSALKHIWTVLQNNKVEVALAGHDHNYERLSPALSNGKASRTGVTQFIVGTGGKSLRPMGKTSPLSVLSDNTNYGALELSLWGNSLDWSFKTTTNGVLDSGSLACF